LLNRLKRKKIVGEMNAFCFLGSAEHRDTPTGIMRKRMLHKKTHKKLLLHGSGSAILCLVCEKAFDL
jgi:hypothetical protein